jgi:anti-sigma B factor antagonist
MAYDTASPIRRTGTLAPDDEEVIVIATALLRVTAHVEPRLHQACIELSGELDLAGAMLVELVLRRAERAAMPILLLDLSALHFIDLSGLRLVLEADARARRRGLRLVLLRPPPEAFSVFALTGVDERLTFLD